MHLLTAAAGGMRARRVPRVMLSRERFAMIFTTNGLNPQRTARRAALAWGALAGAALVLLLAGCDQPAGNGAQSTASTAPAAAPAKIVIGLDDNFPPMGFRDEKNALVGFDIDLAREAAKRLGAQVEFKPIDWSAKEAELNGHRVDALWNGLTITEERKKNIAFTSPYLENRQIIVVTNESPIKAKADLAGKVVGVQDGSTAVDAVERDTATAKSLKELKKFGDNVTALMDLKTGRLDAVVVDEVVGRYYLTKKPGEYRVLDDNFGTEQYGVGVRKDDTALLANLQNALDKMKQDGAAATISGKWFGKDIIVK
jgi:polar amino acid transport system substrate-binding protein